MRTPDLPPPTPPRLWPILALMGPGVLGLAADNDAGGVLSYVVTGASRHLLWFIPALLLMAPITYFIQELALRVAVATQKPFAALMTSQFGSLIARTNGIALHGLNLLTLISEFVGMALALSWFGLPWTPGVLCSFGLVILVTRLKNYRQIERLMLAFAGLTFAFIPLGFMLHLNMSRVSLAFGSLRLGPSTPFLLLALAGNAVAPWMIYWQQNATWAGPPRHLRRGRADIRLGIIVQLLMAVMALLIGALAANKRSSLTIPIANLTHIAGPAGRWLFAIGLFDAGFVAAVTIGLSSSWMIRELMLPSSPTSRLRTPTDGAAGWIHALTLSLAATVVLVPGIDPAKIALWAQAASGLFMPITLFFLAWIALRNRDMGIMRMHRRRTALFGVIILAFVALGVWSIAGMV